MGSTQRDGADTSAKEGGAGLSEAELAALKERTAEVKAERRRSPKADKEPEVLATIAEMPQPDRGLAERIHAIIRDVAPELTSRTWYGMPAYAQDGKVLCFFQAATKFDARYATLGFNDVARLDDGRMWPTAFAVTEIDDAVEARIRELVRRAVHSPDD